MELCRLVMMMPEVVVSKSHEYSAGANTLHLYIVFDMFLYIQVLTRTLRGSYIYFHFVDQKSKAQIIAGEQKEISWCSYFREQLGIPHKGENVHTL